MVRSVFLLKMKTLPLLLNILYKPREGSRLAKITMKSETKLFNLLNEEC